MKNLSKSKKKIAVLTLNDNNNYGNRFQNYATQKVVESYGFDVETIINNIFYTSNNKDRFSKIKKILKLSLREFIILFITKLIYRLNSKKIASFNDDKKVAFDVFSKYINFSSYSINSLNISNTINDTYAYVIVGSDQVWNPHIKQNFRVYLLSYVAKEKRIALSPSFGVNNLPKRLKDVYKKEFLEFSSLSVREESGKKIISDLTGIDVEVLIDPTMMLSKKEWQSISIPYTKKPYENYLLFFFIGKYNKEQNRIIKTIAKERGLKIMRIGGSFDFKYNGIGPSELIDIINSADFICTDSYHITIFSIIFKKDFFTFPRKSIGYSMNSRIETLLRKFKLENRFLENDYRKVSPINYKRIQDILILEKNKLHKYLHEALKL